MWRTLVVMLVAFCGLTCASRQDVEPESPGVEAADARTSESEPADGTLDAGGSDAGVIAPRVLFIGNSYTDTNDLPGVLERIAATSTPPGVTTNRVTVGGAFLKGHWEGSAAQARIKEGQWTHVVLQGQSLEVVFFPADLAEYAARFGDLAADAGARPTLFVTWARAPGDPIYGQAASGGTPDALQDRITDAYADVGRRWPSAVVVRAGEAFRISIRDRPALGVLQADGSHPTVAGTYLAACTFYVAITGNVVPETSEVPSGIAPQDASYLRVVASLASKP